MQSPVARRRRTARISAPRLENLKAFNYPAQKLGDSDDNRVLLGRASHYRGVQKVR
jgi:hypothetical protein